MRTFVGVQDKYDTSLDKFLDKERLDKQFHRQPVYFVRVKEGHPHIGKYVIMMTNVISPFLADKMTTEYNQMVEARGEDAEMFLNIKYKGGYVIVRKLTVGDHAQWINKDLLALYY